jgi:Flp pilus assembly protein TadG
MRLKSKFRPATTAVEFAIVSVFILFPLMFGLIVGGLGVFRYIQIASLAREASRWASVRGAQWVKDNPNLPAASQANIQNFVINQAAGLDTQQITVTSAIGSKVTVTVSYNWSPEVSYFPNVVFTSTSESPMYN